MIEDRKEHTDEKNKTAAAIGLEDDNFNELRQILQKNYKVQYHNSEDEVLELLDGMPEDIAAVIFNAKMVQAEGFALLRRIDENKRFAGIPVIAAAGECDDRLRGLCISKGVNEYFEPPFREDVITLQISQIAASLQGEEGKEGNPLSVARKKVPSLPLLPLHPLLPLPPS